MIYTLGVDLGGTSAKIAMVESRGKIVSETSVVTAGFPNPHKLAARIGQAAAGLAKGAKISRIGVGVAGDIDSNKGVVRVSPNLGWKNVPLKKLLQKNVDCDVIVENDANAAAWGLYKTQVTSSVQSLIVMTLGTGVGGGIILDGKLLRGATGSAGEVGHINIDEQGPLCNCGNRGCLETYVGGPHLVKKVIADLKNGQKSSLQSVLRKSASDLSALTIAQAAKTGDPYALSIWSRVGHALGIAIGDLVYVLNPQMIVFTGGIAQAGDLILKPLKKTLEMRAFKTPVRAVKIKVASRAPSIGVIGAALLE